MQIILSNASFLRMQLELQLPKNSDRLWIARIQKPFHNLVQNRKHFIFSFNLGVLRRGRVFFYKLPDLKNPQSCSLMGHTIALKKLAQTSPVFFRSAPISMQFSISSFLISRSIFYADLNLSTFDRNMLWTLALEFSFMWETTRRIKFNFSRTVVNWYLV